MKNGDFSRLRAGFRSSRLREDDCGEPVRFISRGRCASQPRSGCEGLSNCYLVMRRPQFVQLVQNNPPEVDSLQDRELVLVREIAVEQTDLMADEADLLLKKGMN